MENNTVCWTHAQVIHQSLSGGGLLSVLPCLSLFKDAELLSHTLVHTDKHKYKMQPHTLNAVVKTLIRLQSDSCTANRWIGSIRVTDCVGVEKDLYLAPFGAGV